jgi:hypothetical protein
MIDAQASGGTRTTTGVMRWAPMVGLLALYMLVQLAVLPEIHWGDTLRVYGYATTWPDTTLDHHALRLGVTLPTILSQRLFGYGAFSFYLVAISYGLLLVAGTYLTGRRLFGTAAGVAATVALIMSPYVVQPERFLTSGLILPDLPAAAAFTFGVAYLLRGLEHDQHAPPHAQHRAFVIAGLSFGLAYLVREYVPVMYLTIPIAFLLWHVPLRRMAWVAGPMAGILAFELGVNALVHGDALARFHVAGAHGDPLASPITTGETVGLWLQAFNEPAADQLLFVCLVLLLLSAIVTRDRRPVLLVVWFGSLLAAMLALGGLLDPAAPSLRIVLTRYWFPVFPALLIGGVGAVAQLAQALADRRHFRLASLGAVAGAVWLTAATIAPGLTTVRTTDPDLEWVELRAWLGQEGSSIPSIATDSRTDLQLNVYRFEVIGGGQLWNGRIEEFNHRLEAPPAEVLARTVVLYAPQGPTDAPPEDATVLFRSTDGSLVLIDATE